MELGEQILERLRALPKEGKRTTGKATEEKAVSNNVMLERAALKEKRDWEEESDDTEVDEKVEVEEKTAKGGAKEKLVDI
jgi:hypothetical protein